MVRHLDANEMINAYLDARASQCARNTIYTYAWALSYCYHYQQWSTRRGLPRDPEEIIEFVRRCRLGVNSRQNLYDIVRAFYDWLRAQQDPLFPALPYVYFGRRRARARKPRRYPM